MTWNQKNPTQYAVFIAAEMASKMKPLVEPSCVCFVGKRCLQEAHKKPLRSIETQGTILKIFIFEFDDCFCFKIVFRQQNHATG